MRFRPLRSLLWCGAFGYNRLTHPWAFSLPAFHAACTLIVVAARLGTLEHLRLLLLRLRLLLLLPGLRFHST